MPPEIEIQSFIVKIWLETEGRLGNQSRLHGYVTHVLTGERRYIHQLDDLPHIIRQFLQTLQTAQPPHQPRAPRIWSRFVRWMCRIKPPNT